MVDIKIQLPDSFFEEEERWGFKITKDRKELWAVQLDLLCEFDRVCKKLGLRYFLDSGTLLGAVRDGHFIPWDDDIDVVMLREDYDKFLELGPAEFSSPMFLQNAYTDIDYRRGLSQLRRSDTTFILKREIEKRLPFNQGICIDIFPLDGIAPDSELEQHFEEKQAIRKQISTLVKQENHIPAEVRELFRQYETICSRYAGTGYIEKIMHRRNVSSILRLKDEWYVSTIELEFEGLYFQAPIGWHEILAQHYGSSYLIPNPIPTFHGDTIWSTEGSYVDTIHALRLDEF